MSESNLAQRKQPRQTRAAATVEAIIEAAARILARDGLARFNTNRVAELAGVSIGSLYQYFPHKDALMAALIAREQAVRVRQLAAAVDAVHGLPLGQAIDALIAGVIAQDDGALARLLDLEEQRLPLASSLEPVRVRLDLELVRFLRWHFAGREDAELLRAARSARLVAQVLIDGWSHNPDVAAAETRAAVIGCLSPLGTSSCGTLPLVSESL